MRASPRVEWRATLALVTALVVTVPVSAQTMSSFGTQIVRGSLLDRRARLEAHDVTLEAALFQLARNSGVLVTYSPSLLDANTRRVTCACADVSVGEALDRLLAGTSVRPVELRGQIALTPELAPAPAPVASVVAPPPAPMLYLASAPAPPPPVPLAGAITGRVTDAATGQPLASAQVFISALNLGTLAQADGRYRLENVPAGTHTVSAQLIGYGTVTHDVTVADGQTAVQDFALAQQALQLNEIVITGTPGATQRRAIGNVVARVDAAKVLEKAPVADVQQLLGQRTPGLVVLPSAGQVGTGSPIRIRGTNSMSLTNDPIVYIDGVRMDSDPRAGPSTRGGSRISLLNQVNPDDIESIEIIKGPSAATLYGTEASNGVIQIITKRGKTGKPQLDVSIRTGANWLQDPEARAGGQPTDRVNGLQWRRNPTTGELEGINLLRHEASLGNPSIFRTGLQQGYDLSLRGGTDAARYFTSVSWDHDGGVVGYDYAKRFTARANLDIGLAEHLFLQTSTGVVQSRIRLAQNPGGFGAEPFSNVIWGNPNTLDTPQRGFMVAPPEEWRKVETRGDNDRVTTSAVLRYEPLPWMSHRLAVGFDQNELNNWQLWPRQPEGTPNFWGSLARGQKSIDRLTTRFLTADYSGSATAKLRDFTLTTSLGIQYYGRRTLEVDAQGSEFPAVPITTISGGAQRTGGETFVENRTLGAFAQEQVSWNNRVFVTGAVRADDNSAFGKEFNAAIYPKFSATWVVSEEPFWHVPWLDQLRLRTAWGQAGQQPGTFDAPRLFTPEVGYGDQPSLVPSSYGNPALKPERGQELEAGFDLAVLNNRVGIVYTRFQRSTKDAIVNRPVSGSTGFSGSQIVNLGRISSWGNELGLTLQAVRRRSFRWELDGQLATMHNRIDDLGGLAFVPAGGQQFHEVGYPIGAFFAKRVLSAKIDAKGNVTEALCDGGTGRGGVDSGGAPVPCASAPRVYWGTPTPTWELGLTSTFTFFNNLSVYGRVEGNGGHWEYNSELRAAHNVGVTRDVLCKCDPIMQATRLYENNVMGFLEGGFLRLREVGASYNLPSALLARTGASRASISVAARNLYMLWTKAQGWDTWRDGRIAPPSGLGGRWSWDAELRSSDNVQVDQQTVLPPFASATVMMRVSF
ncbi:MAG TPA: SusC/RagA family TonB-linked outer membrane protein [Longimicrobiales bacterium]|nr:SusC/RagA family TonB-linked outer membrane protein [Longimicrobiales bacterium]